MEAERFNGLLRLIDMGDESALNAIHAEYGKRIKWVAYSILGDWHHAKDVLNAVMKTLWNKSHKFQNIQNPFACIYDLAKKASYTFYRDNLKKKQFEVALDVVPEEEAARFLVHTDDHSEFEFLSMIGCLNEIEREIIVKKIAFKFTHVEIAQDLNIPEGTIKWKYGEILDKLRKKIEEDKNSS